MLGTINQFQDVTSHTPHVIIPKGWEPRSRLSRANQVRPLDPYDLPLDYSRAAEIPPSVSLVVCLLRCWSEYRRQFYRYGAPCPAILIIHYYRLYILLLHSPHLDSSIMARLLHPRLGSHAGPRLLQHDPARTVRRKRIPQMETETKRRAR